MKNKKIILCIMGFLGILTIFYIREILIFIVFCFVFILYQIDTFINNLTIQNRTFIITIVAISIFLFILKKLIYEQNFRTSLYNTKLKKILWFIVLLLAIFIKIVPNYNTKYGFEIVNIFDYYDYKNGYCLQYNKVFEKDELFKRAVKSFFLTTLKEAQYQREYQYWEETFSYNRLCSGGGCFFYALEFKDLDKLNMLIKSEQDLGLSKFIDKYGTKIDPEYTQILGNDKKLTDIIIFDNKKHFRLYAYLPNAFSLFSSYDIELDKELMDKNKKSQFPTSAEYSGYYLKVRELYPSSSSNLKVFTNYIDYYIPITTCGHIKFSDIFDEPGGMKYVFRMYGEIKE